MKKTILFTFLSVFLMAGTSFAKTDNSENNTKPSAPVSRKVIVRGIVVDSETKAPLVGAVVAVSDGDTGAITDEGGNFRIALTSGSKVMLNVSYLGYETLDYDYIVPQTEVYISDPITLVRSSMELTDVTVRGQAPIGLVKGDTTQYNASAFKANPDASTSDLLAKMPGMEVSDDGSVTTQGEAIEVIYVDGRSYFKNDVATALASLPANIVESVQVFDERSAQGKFLNYDDGDNKKAINIVTKGKVRKVNWVGEAMAGYGTDDRYMASVNLNMLGEKDRMVIGAATNNINVAPNRQQRFYGMGGGAGINSAIGARINYIRDVKDGEIAFSYIFDNDNKDIQTRINSEELSTDRIKTFQLDSAFNRSFTHRFNIDYQQTINPRNRIESDIHFDVSSNDNFNRVFIQDSIPDASGRYGLLNESDTDNKSAGNGIDFRGDLTYIHKFNDKRDLSIEVEGSYSDTKSSVIQTGYTTGELVSEIDQKTINRLLGNSVGGDVRYTENIGKNSRLVFRYQLEYNWGDSDRKLYDYDSNTGTLTELNEELSSVYNRDYLLNTGGLGYLYTTKKHRVNLWVNYQHAALQSQSEFPMANKMVRNFDGVNVRANYRYKGDNEDSFNVMFRTAPSYPSVENLQEVLDVSDPLHVTKGNSMLQPSQNTRVRFMYNKSNVNKSTVFRVMAMVNNTQNAVSNSTVRLMEPTIIDGYEVAKGAQYTRLINMDGNWSAFGGAWYSFPLTKLKTNMEIGLMYHYNRTPFMKDEIKKITNSNAPALMLRFTSNITENIDFNIFNRVEYTFSQTTSPQEKELNHAIVESATARFNYIFFKGFFINVDYTFRYNWFIDMELDQPVQHQLNAAIGKKFFNDKFEIRATAFDILDQNKAIRQNVSGENVQNIVYNNLERYFAISLRYKFNTMKNGAVMPSMDSYSHRGGSH